jgi:hypothetical protein
VALLKMLRGITIFLRGITNTHRGNTDARGEGGAELTIIINYVNVNKKKMGKINFFIFFNKKNRSRITSLESASIDSQGTILKKKEIVAGANDLQLRYAKQSTPVNATAREFYMSSGCPNVTISF